MEPLDIKILISTLGKRIERVPDILLPPREDVAYIVSWQGEANSKQQETCPQPAGAIDFLFHRKDVVLSKISGLGLSANRNNAIAESQKISKKEGQSLWILADDDIRLRADWLDSLKTLASANEGTDLFVLQAMTPDGKPLHWYPDKPFVYPDVPKGFYFNSMGMVLRSGRQWPAFDARFGLGAPVLKMGEEDIFIRDCHKAGLKISYFPQPIVITEATTTSSGYNSDPALQMSKGAVLTLLHGKFWALPRLILTAIRMRKSLPVLPHLRNLLKGRKYILSTPQPK